MRPEEMDLLKAEALIRRSVGDIPAAVALINKTRVNNGGLPPLPATMTRTSLIPGAAPGAAGAACVPRSFRDPSKCGTIMDALLWEKRLESSGVETTINWADWRRFGMLRTGSLISPADPRTRAHRAATSLLHIRRNHAGQRRRQRHRVCGPRHTGRRPLESLAVLIRISRLQNQPVRRCFGPSPRFTAAFTYHENETASGSDRLVARSAACRPHSRRGPEPHRGALHARPASAPAVRSGPSRTTARARLGGPRSVARDGRASRRVVRV